MSIPIIIGASSFITSNTSSMGLLSGSCIINHRTATMGIVSGPSGPHRRCYVALGWSSSSRIPVISPSSMIENIPAAEVG